MVTKNNRRMCPSGLNRHGGLLDKRGSGGRLGSHYRVNNYNNENANPLHMNAHSFGNNCNQYIYLRSVCRLDGGCLVTYPYHLGAAHQEVQDPVAEGGV